MGNVCSVSVSTDDVGYCCACTASRVKYGCKLEENRATLTTELQRLRELSNDVKRKVDMAERQQMKRLDQVQGWLSRVEHIKTQVSELIGDGKERTEDRSLCGSCYPRNCISSYKLGKEVVRKLDQVAALINQGRFDAVADIVPPPPVEEIPSGPTVGLESTFDHVWRCLGEEDVGIISIYGMGGVGKSTLLTQINNHFLQTNHNFEVVIWAVVSRTPNMDEVQENIWKKVGYCDDRWKNKSRAEKAKDIWRVLSKKRFVMLLDDMWEVLNFLEVGIPIPNQHNKSKLIFTTRSQEVGSQMGAQKKIEVKCLAWKESWDLFKKYVGEDALNSDPKIPELAEIVAKECCGLPLVLITLGRAMAGKKTPQEWEHAIRVLQTSTSKFAGMGDRVFPLLKYSFDSLPSEIVQSCFLYFSLYPEDTHLNKEHMVYTWICEGFLDEFDNMDAAKNYGFSIMSTLVHACLLEETKGTYYIKIHDVIRDMTIWLTGEVEEMKGKYLIQERVGLIEALEIHKWEGAERISLIDNQTEKLTGSPTCPNLSTLFLHRSCLQKIADGFFQFMPNLRILSLFGTKITELPTDIYNLVSLEYLDLSCSNIKKLPIELKKLQKMKALKLYSTIQLSSIPPQLISNLSMLQMVDMFKCEFSDQVAEDSSQSDGSKSLVGELDSLNYLGYLAFTITSAAGLERFLSSRKLLSCTSGLCLKIFKGLCSLNMATLKNMKHLNLLHMDDFDTLREIKLDWAGKENEKVEYSNFNPKLKCFHRLRSIHIKRCQVLKNLTWVVFVPNLDNLGVSNCYEMEEIIGNAAVNGGNLSPFTKLREMVLIDLPQLKSVYWNPLPFPYLERIEVVNCPKLKKLPLNSNTAKERGVVIEGTQEWWNELEWEDEATLNAFLPSFISIEREAERKSESAKEAGEETGEEQIRQSI